MVDRTDLVEWPTPALPPARLPLYVYVDAVFNGLRVVVALAATAWFFMVFWWPGAGWRDGPPEIDWFIWTFHVPLALGLTLGGSLLVRSRGVPGLLGLLCLTVLVPAVIEIVVTPLTGGPSGVWVYCRR